MKRTTWVRRRLVCLILLLTIALTAYSNDAFAISDNQTAGRTSNTIATPIQTEEEITLTSSEFLATPKTVHFIGRYHVDAQAVAYGFYNVAAGFTFAFMGTSLELALSATAYQEYNLNYVAVTIDDREPVAVCIDKDGWYMIADDLVEGVTHTVKVLKRTMSNAGAVCVKKIRLSEGARLFRVPVMTEHRLQVLGDSITCGYGTLWDGSDTEEVTKWQDGSNSYAVMTAERLNAELQVIAISGIGVGNAANEPYALLPHYKQEDMFNNIECDFSAYVPDAVIIALGTNDFGQGNPPEIFKVNATRMIKFIRKQYPDAIIVWMYGVMGGASYSGVIQEMVEQLNAQGEKDLYFLPMDPPNQNEPIGQHGHPGQMTHVRMADQLTAFLCNVTGWSDAANPISRAAETTEDNAKLIPITAEQTEKYDLEIFTQDLFAGDKVYYDSICFAEKADGSITDGVLLYTPDEIISVWSTDLQTEYFEGHDFVVSGNRLIRTQNSRIPVFRYSQYCQTYANNNATAWLRIVGTDRELRLSNDMLGCQVFVTYLHSDKWESVKATSQLSHLPSTAAKLIGKEKLKIVFLGDSITCGYDASGLDEMVILWESNTQTHAVISRAPYMPSWAEMVTAKLRETYGYEDIIKVNRASGGSSTFWGKTAASAWVNPESPDLVVIAFGMNQAATSKEEFKADITSIIQVIHQTNPDTEFLLVSCMMPNTDSVSFKKHKLAQQEEALYAVQSELPGIGIGVVPVHSVFASLVNSGKKFVDFTSNNINHPNDFGARVYAQLILTALNGH